MQEEIVKSWITYIDFERLEKTRVNPATINTETFFNFENFREQIDTVTIDFNKFDGFLESLKKGFPIEKDEEGNDQRSLYLYFPLIRTQEQWGEVIHPLFAIDITHQKYELFSSGKLYLLPHKEADYIPYAAAFHRFLGVTEGLFQESLPLNRILGRLLGQNYNNFEESLAAFKQFVKSNLLSGIVHTQDCFLGCADMEDHAKELQGELELLKDVNLESSPLAARYLHHAEGDETGEELGETDLWRGAFTDQYPLSRSQAEVLRRLKKGDDMIPVQAAPGTGKTSLFLSVIANQIVERAIHLAETGQDTNNLMVYVSCSNRGVDSLLEQFENDKKFRAPNNLFFNGGKRENILASLPRLEKFIAELKTRKFDPDRHEKARQRLLGAVDDLENIRTEYVQKEERLQEVLEKGSNAFGGEPPESWQAWVDFQRDAFFEQMEENGFPLEWEELEKIELWLKDRLMEVEDYQKELASIQNKHPQVNILLFDPESLELQKARDDLQLLLTKMSTLPFWQIESVFKKKTALFVGWITEHEAVLKNIFKDFYSLTYKDTSNLIAAFNSLFKDVARLEEKKPDKALLTADLQKLIELAQQCDKEQNDVERLLAEYRRIKEAVSSYKQSSFTEYYRLQTIREQRKLYELSMTFLNEEMVRRKLDVIASLRDWTDLIAHNNGKWITQKWEEQGFTHHFTLISLVYPLLTTCLEAYNNFFKDFFYFWKERQSIVNKIEEEKPIHLVLADESSMTGVHALFPLLYKSVKALVVGDPRQLELETTIGITLANAYEHANFASAALAAQYSPVTVTPFHRGAGCKSGRFDNPGQALLLQEHHRCQEDIANLFIDVAGYSGMQIQTVPLQGEAKERLERLGGKNLVFYDIEGARGEWCNTNDHEITAIGRILDKLGAAGYQLNKDVCILTPFISQEQQLIKSFGQRLHHTGYSPKIGTPATFQGGDSEVVIFSPVIFSAQDSTWILNEKPHCITVAVSLARHLFITCGNYQYLSAAGGNLAKLCQHHLENGYVLEGTPDDQIEKGRKSQTNDYLDTCNHLQYFQKALQQAEEELVIISPLLGTSRHHFQQLDWIKDAMERDVQVQVYYGWKQGDNNEDAIRHYENVLGNNLIRVKQDSPENCIIRDRKEMAIGSFNWLSHRYGDYCHQEDSRWTRASIRKESSMVVRESNAIEEVLHGLN